MGAVLFRRFGADSLSRSKRSQLWASLSPTGPNPSAPDPNPSAALSAIALQKPYRDQQRV